jgi:cysteine desulfurase
VTRAYLDHASTSPLRPVALEAMLPYLRDHHADPGRLHAEAHVTRVAVEDAREQVAARFGARPREVVFTASGTEAVNTAVFGAVARAGGGHVVATAVEHSSVLDAIARTTDDVTVVGVDRQGRFDARAVADAVRPDTALVSVQLANHEVGTLQPAAEIVELVHAGSDAVVHVDACAAAGHVPVDFGVLGADLCSITGHTFGGPKGASALLVRRGLRFPPFVVGGAQERARRAGIENVPAIVGFGAACDAIAGPQLENEAARERALSERLADLAVRRIDGIERFGDPIECLPHLVCLGVDGVEAEPILLALDQRGVAVHSGSSCSSESLEPSPVLAAMGVDADRSLRASVGWSSTDADVDAFLDALPVVVGLLRDLRR